MAPAPTRIHRMVKHEQFDMMIKARSRLILNDMFFGPLVFKLGIREAPNIPTAATDGRYIYYNPEFIETLNMPECVGLVVHEILHCMYAHFTRRGAQHPVLWNQAGDYVINIIAVDSGYTLPEGALLDRKYDEMTTEQVYDLLETDNPEPPDQPTDDDGLPIGPTPGAPTDRVFESPNLTPSEIVQEEDSWEIAVLQAAETARKAGKLPAGIEQLIEAYRKPTINWRSAMRKFFNVYTKRDYSWGRVKKRLVSQNIYLPSLHSEDLDNLVVGIDTSGSVTDDEREAFAAELNQILADFDANITFIYCDTVVYEPVETFHTDQLPKEIKGVFTGGGGTALQPILDYIEDKGLSPSCFVYLTDGGIWDDPAQPPYPCLVITTTDIEIPIGDNVRLTL